MLVIVLLSSRSRSCLRILHSLCTSPDSIPLPILAPVTTARAARYSEFLSRIQRSNHQRCTCQLRRLSIELRLARHSYPARFTTLQGCAATASHENMTQRCKKEAQECCLSGCYLQLTNGYFKLSMDRRELALRAVIVGRSSSH